MGMTLGGCGRGKEGGREEEVGLIVSSRGLKNCYVQNLNCYICAGISCTCPVLNTDYHMTVTCFITLPHIPLVRYGVS